MRSSSRDFWWGRIMPEFSNNFVSTFASNNIRINLRSSQNFYFCQFKICLFSLEISSFFHCRTIEISAHTEQFVNTLLFHCICHFLIILFIFTSSFFIDCILKEIRPSTDWRLFCTSFRLEIAVARLVQNVWLKIPINWTVKMTQFGRTAKEDVPQNWAVRYVRRASTGQSWTFFFNITGSRGRYHLLAAC